MQELTNFFAENQMLVYALICLVLALILCLVFPTKKKLKEEKVEPKKEDVVKTEPSNNIINEIKEKAPEIRDENKVVTPVIEKVAIPSNDEEIIDTSIPDRHLDLDALLSQMQKDVNATADPVESFENNEEDSAIISFKQLSGTNTVTTNSPVPTVVTNEPIEKPVESEAVRRFKSSEFISPIYGKVEKEVSYPKVKKFDSNQVIEPEIQEEYVKTNTPDEAFLESLKEFRSNLNE